MPTAEKEKTVREIADKLSEAKSVFLTDFTGLNVEEISALRRACSGASVEYRVVKNTLARLSAKEAGCDVLIEHFEGPTGLVLGMEDPVAPAKIIKEFCKKSDKLKVRACLFEGAFFGRENVESLADLSSRETLLTQLAGVLNAPMSNLASSLSAIISKIVYALDRVKEQKEA